MQNERLQTGGKMQNVDYRLQARGKMKEKTAGNTSTLLEVRRNLFNIVKMFAIFSCSDRKVCLLIEE